MKVNIREVPRGGLSTDITVKAATLEKLTESLDFSLLGDVTGHLDVNRSKGGIIEVRGSFDSKVNLQCSRCLGTFVHPIRNDFIIYYKAVGDAPENKVSGDKVSGGGAKGEDMEHELTAEDLDIAEIKGSEIDCGEVILEQIALEIPMKPLCSEGCPGICPSCGADLNNGECGCVAEERIDPRLKALKDFKVKPK